jgi:hypothetical protein
LWPFSRFVLLALLAGVANAQTSQAAHEWPVENGTYIIKDFRFGSGESLAELKLHYLTLGQPNRDAAGHTDNAVLLLHGTGGDAHSLLNPVFSDVLFAPGQPLDRQLVMMLPGMDAERFFLELAVILASPHHDQAASMRLESRGP